MECQHPYSCLRFWGSPGCYEGDSYEFVSCEACEQVIDGDYPPLHATTETMIHELHPLDGGYSEGEALGKIAKRYGWKMPPEPFPPPTEEERQKALEAMSPLQRALHELADKTDRIMFDMVKEDLRTPAFYRFLGED